MEMMEGLLWRNAKKAFYCTCNSRRQHGDRNITNYSSNGRHELLVRIVAMATKQGLSPSPQTSSFLGPGPAAENWLYRAGKAWSDSTSGRGTGTLSVEKD